MPDTGPISVLGRFKSLLGGDKLNVAKRFDLLDKGLAGTLSVVYKAREKQTGKIVGLKILDLKKLTEYELRFKGLKKPSEGEIAMQIRHAGAVETTEYGVTSDGAPYLVMEYIGSGETLDRLLAGHDKRLSGHRRQFIRQAAEALAAVHDAGFIHRDICPQNFVLAADGEHIKLIDFGSAVPATRPFMQPGNRTGRRNYAAPELVARRQTDQRVDVFAFGVTAYKICSLQLPWSEPTGSSAIVNTQRPKDIRELCPGLHPGLAKAIHQCIDLDVAKRCKSMEDFLGAVP